jgi:hypothetical protein
MAVGKLDFVDGEVSTVALLAYAKLADKISILSKSFDAVNPFCKFW